MTQSNAPTPTGVASTNLIDQQLTDLVDRHLEGDFKNLVDFGHSGELLKDLRWKLGSEHCTVIHGNENALDQLRSADVSGPVDQWKVVDFYDLPSSDLDPDALIMANVLHEVYSLEGRAGNDTCFPINHELGMDCVRRVLGDAASILKSGGALLIATEVLGFDGGDVEILLKTDEARQAARSLDNIFMSRDLKIEWQGDDRVCLDADAASLFVSAFDVPDRVMVRPFFTIEDWRVALHDMGFDLRLMASAPEGADEHRQSGYEILSGAENIPATHMALVALKR